MIPKDLHIDIHLLFEPRNLWIGVYWKRRRSIESTAQWLELYVCVLPMLPIHIEFAWGWKIQDKAYEAYCQQVWDKGMVAIGYKQWKEKQVE